jgi:hypothetical protein
MRAVVARSITTLVQKSATANIGKHPIPCRDKHPTVACDDSGVSWTVSPQFKITME